MIGKIQTCFLMLKHIRIRWRFAKTIHISSSHSARSYNWHEVLFMHVGSAIIDWLVFYPFFLVLFLLNITNLD